MLRSEHGELIARNHEELDQLRRMGENDYYEFTLNSKGQKQHVGSMQIELRGVNAKKHQFTVALYVDDMRLEKKNKSINEPIYFYASGSRAPLELVVNQVSDKKIAGYLSVPKAVATSAKGQRKLTHSGPHNTMSNERAPSGALFRFFSCFCSPLGN